MKRLVLVAIVLGFLLTDLTASKVFAGIGEADDWTIHQQYLSPRALGMGGAFTAVADDYFALFYNPAGLARLQERELNVGIAASLDKDATKFYNDIKTASDGKGDDTSEMLNLLQQNYGHHYSARVTTLPVYWAWKGSAFAVIPADLSVEADIRQAVGPAAAIVATEDTTIAYGRGYNIRVNGGQLSVGATLRGVYRLYVNKTALGVDLAEKSDIFTKGDEREGFGVDGDVGALYTPNLTSNSFLRYLKPTFGLAIRNIADAGYGWNFHLLDKDSTQPYREERRIDAGVRFDLPDWWVFKTHLALEEHDMLHENFTWLKGEHAGLEFLWKVRSWWQGGWRVGLGEGYLSGGFTAIAGVFQLDLLTYGEEVGPSTARKENRRYMVKTSLDF